MKKIFAIALLMFVFTLIKAGNADTIRINSIDQTITVGSLIIKKGSTIESLKSLLGTPTKVTSIGGLDRRYIYDDLGIAFEANEDGKTFSAITVNYNWDGDKKVASGKFKGVLLVDGFAINESMKGEDISKNTKIKGLTCMGTLMCMTDPKAKGLMVLIGFQSNKITQIGFGVK